MQLNNLKYNFFKPYVIKNYKRPTNTKSIKNSVNFFLKRIFNEVSNTQATLDHLYQQKTHKNCCSVDKISYIKKLLYNLEVRFMMSVKM